MLLNKQDYVSPDVSPRENVETEYHFRLFIDHFYNNVSADIFKVKNCCEPQALYSKSTADRSVNRSTGV